jgi:hypothetical protein
VLGATAGLLISTTTGCFSASESAEQVQPAAPIEAPSPCQDPDPSDALTSFSGLRCPLELVRHTDGLRLRSLDPRPEAPATGPIPEPCEERPCDWEGVLTPLGPMIVVSVRSPHSEMAEGALLGWVQGTRLRFVDLWDGAGDSVIGDSTPLGPAFSLAPFACGTDIALFAAPRLDTLEGLEPPDTLSAREGLYTLTGDVPQRRDGSREGCQRLFVPVP